MFKKLKNLYSKKETIEFFQKINHTQKHKKIDSVFNNMPFKDGKFNAATFDESCIVLHQTSIGGYTTYEHPGIRNKYLIIRHTYNQNVQEFPSFYCDANSKRFIRYSESFNTEYGDTLYPDSVALYDISKFKKLIELVRLKDEKNINKKYKLNAFQIQKDRDGNILKCSKCLSMHLHKKGQRTLLKKVIQRYQCQSCKKIFSITLSKL